MDKKLTDNMLIELYYKNYTLKEIALLYGYVTSSIHRRVKKLIETGKLTERPRLRKNKSSIYGSDDRVIVNIKDNNSSRTISDHDIVNLVGCGFKYSKISLITGLPIDMIIDIAKKYKEYKDNSNDNINKWYIIELYNNKFNKFQIRYITGYTEQVISSVIDQAIRCGFINRNINYIPNVKEKKIMEMYKNYTSINTIATTNKLSKESVNEIIEKLIDSRLLEERNNATRIINRKRINLGLEDENIIRMYNLCISEDCIAKYYKVRKNIIIDALLKIDKSKINIYDKITDMIKNRKNLRQISILLDIPLEVLYEHLRETVR